MKKPKLKPNPNRKRYHRRKRTKNPAVALTPLDIRGELRKAATFANLLSAAFLFLDAHCPDFMDKVAKRLDEPEAADTLVPPESIQ
jgi:hypothetical protein